MVKDFSRFARDYIELGSYLEQIFPFLGVRLISLNDGYDSAKGDGVEAESGLQLAFQNLLYDWYSKDLSIKVKTSLKTKKEKGFYISSSPPYGYQKDASDQYRVTICKEEAEIVHSIFSLALQGNSLCEIAKLLNRQGVPTRTNHALWRTGTIYQILKNPFYTGDLLYNKYENRKAGEKSYQKAREDWKRISNHHSAIVEREIFEEVQQLYGKKREKNQKNRRKKSALFTGKLFCAACQKTLQRKNTKTPYFTCTTRYITDAKSCVKRLEADQISQIVRQFLRNRIVSCQMQKEIKSRKEYYCRQKREELQKKLQKIEAELVKLSQKKAADYKKYMMSCMEKDRYLEWKSQIQKREEEWMELQKQYDKKIIDLKKAEQETEESFLICQDFVEIFIKKILVFDKKKLVIYWNFW